MMLAGTSQAQAERPQHSSLDGGRNSTQAADAMSLRRQAMIAVLISSIIAELALVALVRFFPYSSFVQGATVVVNLPGEIAVALFMMFGGAQLLPQGKYLEEAILVAGATISVGAWGLLAWFVFRKDRSDLLTAFYEAVLLDRLMLLAIALFLGTGIWLCVKVADEGDISAPALLCGAALCLVGYARKRSRFE